MSNNTGRMYAGANMYDFCINGGGMVGAATALGLAKKGYSIAIIEPNMPLPFERESKPDIRVSAISQTSVDLLDTLGAWRHIASMRVKPYTGLSVWENTDSRTDFTAKSIDMPQLGYFVENRLIQLGCHQALAQYDNVVWFTQDKVTTMSIGPSGATVKVGNHAIEARWIIGADGANSQVRNAAHIGQTGWQYQQQAMGILVEMAHKTDPITWQQFTPSGPRAFLPLFGRYASLVWYDDEIVLKSLKKLSSTQLKAKILSAFPAELQMHNDFEVLDRASFPLTRAHANKYVSQSAILIGDAAHTINPLAGQGVNLGFKDVGALLDCVERCSDVRSVEFSKRLLSDYEAVRRKDNLLMMSAMDGFYALFSNANTFVSVARNKLLELVQGLKPLKKQVLAYAIGVQKWK